jgi:pantoate--beta-alanine ligase
MKVIESIKEMKEIVLQARGAGKIITFVPTMGYFHEGHLSLMREGKRRGDLLVVSIFVNPTQFGPMEDFKSYPRDLQRDFRILERERADVVFAPPDDEMYPSGSRTFVEVQGLQDRLCGKSRPGHFRGVCTVVLKLFHIIRPMLPSSAGRTPSN